MLQTQVGSCSHSCCYSGARLGLALRSSRVCVRTRVHIGAHAAFNSSLKFIQWFSSPNNCPPRAKNWALQRHLTCCGFFKKSQP